MYPPEYKFAILEAHQAGTFSIVCAGSMEAKSLRSNLYAYRTNLRRTDNEISAFADSLRFEVDGPVLVITRYEGLGVNAIRSALASSKTEEENETSTPD